MLSILDVQFLLTINEFFIHGLHEMALDQYVPWICMFKKYLISVFAAFRKFLILLLAKNVMMMWPFKFL